MTATNTTFNKNFYPTPTEVIDMMQIDCRDAVVLEPSAGSGNMIDWALSHGAKKVYCCEQDEKLQLIAKSKGIFIKPNFFEVSKEEVSHIDTIIMNPPFDTAHKHILHAWEIAPDGCSITSLCNSTLIENWRHSRTDLKYIVNTYGDTFELGEVFRVAERTTNVNVSVVKLYKPISNDNSNFEGFYMDAEPEEITGEGIMQFDEIKSIVNSYIGAIKCWDDFQDVNEKMGRLTSSFGITEAFSYKLSYNETTCTKSEFESYIQKRAWTYLFNKMNLAKYVTKGVNEDINKFINQQQKIPFTVKNIYRMFEIIVGTKEQTMNRAIVEAVDNFTKHTHENRFGVEGWKTNEGHLLNIKFITGYISEPNWSSGLGIKYYNGNFEYLIDLTKAMCYLTGTDFNSIPSITLSSCEKNENGDYKSDPNNSNRRLNENRFIPNTWYEWGFFKFKVFKKGTGHFQFKYEKDWELINRAYGKIKGFVLPEKL